MSTPPEAQFHHPADAPVMAPDRPRRPGWTELGVAAVTFVIVLAITAVILGAIPKSAATVSGLVAFALSAAAGLAPFYAAMLARIRKVAAFGVRKVAGKWLGIGAAVGLGCFVLSMGVSLAYRVITGDTTNVQGGYQSAATGGIVTLLGALLLGAVATPIGEEFLWRGVVTNALSRYGAWVSVLVSAAAFAVAHGVNVVMPVAFIIGVANALLLRKTGSLWPGVFAHGVNNALSSLVPAVIALAGHA